VPIPWAQLYAGRPPRRISVPTYPFAKDKYWLAPEASSTAAARGTVLHPLLHENTSDLREQRYSSRFTGEEPCLAHHVVLGERMLPGVAYLEMARAALERATAGDPGTEVERARSGLRQLELENVVWTRPLTVRDEPCRVHVALHLDEELDDEIGFEIFSEDSRAAAEGGTERVVHCQGHARLVGNAESERIAIEELGARCAWELTAEQCYDAFSRMGLEYGPAHRGLERVRVGVKDGERYVVAQLHVPACVLDGADGYVLHPSVMDSALQATIGLLANEHGQLPSVPAAQIPYALDELRIPGRCPQRALAYIRGRPESQTSGLRKLDVDLCDADGRVWARAIGLSTREPRDARGLAGSEMTTSLMQAIWEPAGPGAARPSSAGPQRESRHVLVIGAHDGPSSELATESSGEQWSKQLSALLEGVDCHALETSAARSPEQRYEACAVQILERLQRLHELESERPRLLQLAVRRIERPDQELF
jgi:polyketide synthase PksM